LISKHLDIDTVDGFESIVISLFKVSDLKYISLNLDQFVLWVQFLIAVRVHVGRFEKHSLIDIFILSSFDVLKRGVRKDLRTFMFAKFIIEIDLVQIVLILAAVVAAPEGWLEAKEGVSAPTELFRHHLFKV